ncbi:ATP-dependent nuclease [Methanosarcina siciliae]|nr:AAA family ATPase [Methanosarcina siciliae]
MVLLKLKSLYIKNFRNIKELEMEFSLLTVIVGENNAGKTTILKALYKILKMDESPHRIRFFEDDFYFDKSSNKRSTEIAIELSFDELDENDKTAFVWSGIDISNNQLSVRLEAKWEEENNDASVELFFVRKDDPENPKGENFKLTHKRYIPFYYIDAYRDIWKETNSSNGDLKQIFKDHNKHYLKPLNAQIASCIKNIELYLNEYWEDEDSSISEILFEIDGNLEDFAFDNSMPLVDCLTEFNIKLADCDRRLDKCISETEPQDKELIKKIQQSVQNICQKTSIQQTIEELQAKMNGLHGIQEIKSILNENLSLFVPESQIEIDLAKIEESSLLDENHVSLEDVSIFKQGSGFQGSFVIALKLSRLFTHMKFSDDELTNLIVSIEEPEAHMHPHLQRSLIKKLKAKQKVFAEMGYNVQLIITTHSPSILSQIEKSDICLLSKKNDECKIVKLDQDFEHQIISELGAKEKLKHFDFVFRQYPEIFLSRGVIIVEGQSEFGAIPEFARIMNVDLDNLGISVINSGGKGSAKPMYLIIKKFTNCVAIKDNDNDLSDPLIEDQNEPFFTTDYIDFEEEIITHIEELNLIRIFLDVDSQLFGDYYLGQIRRYIEETRRMDVSELLSKWEELDFSIFLENTNSVLENELTETLKKHKSSLFSSMICSHLSENEIPECYKKIILKAKEMVM